MKLQYKIDDKFDIKSKKYIVIANATFDVILRFIDLLDDDNLSPNIILNTGIRMLLGKGLEDLPSVEKRMILERIINKYLKSKPKVIYDLTGNPMPQVESDIQVIDYNEDSKYIYSAFMQVYGIDLFEEQGKLHWNKFQALMDGLPDDTKLSQIIHFRTWEESDDKKDYKQYMREQKQYWSLGGED